jgi:hypothetical protein
VATASRTIRKKFSQKAFWLRKDLAKRLAKVVKVRKRKESKYSERIAMSLAIRSFIEIEEVTLGLVKPRDSGNS